MISDCKFINNNGWIIAIDDIALIRPVCVMPADEFTDEVLHYFIYLKSNIGHGAVSGHAIQVSKKTYETLLNVLPILHLPAEDLAECGEDGE